MSERPGALTRLRAAVRGERSAEALEAFRRAGVDAYDLLRTTEDGARVHRARGGRLLRPARGGHDE